jgi:DNA primase
MLYKLQNLLNQKGLVLLKDIRKDAPHKVSITCPIHKQGMESNPSCGVLLKQVNTGGRVIPEGTVHCFTCGYKATFDEFLLLFFDSYKDVKTFKKGFILIDGKRQPLTLHFNEGIKPSISHCEEDLTSYNYYHSYMYKRGLTNKVIDFFDVGYDENTTSVTFPIKDMYGNLLMIQRRNVIKKRFDNGLNSKKGSVLYGGYEINKYIELKKVNDLPEIWITESPIDCLTCWVNKKCAVATMGAKITNYQLDLIKDLPTKKLVLAFDNDEAGHKAGQLVSKHLKSKLVYKAILPDNIKDINECTDFEDIKKELYFF